MHLSKRAARLYQFIREYWTRNGYAPTHDEMRQGINLKSKSNIGRLLDELRDAGLVAFEDGVARSIRLVRESIDIVWIRLCGSISAGKPIPELDDPDSETLPFLRTQLPKSIALDSLLTLRVDGDSMTDASIQDDDLIVLTKQFLPTEGDTLAFRLTDGSLTLKKYYRDGDYVLLQPANPKYETLRLHQEQVEPFAKLVLVLRSPES